LRQEVAYFKQMSRLSKFFSVQYHRFKHGLTQIRDTPHAIAGGVAIGVIFGFTPLFGFKTLLAVLVAWLFRCSKLSAVLVVTLHDILIPLSPFILRWQFQIGFFIISRPHRLPPKLPVKHFHFENYMSWKTLHILWPTFVGSLFFGIPLAILMYFIVLAFVTRAHAARAAHARRTTQHLISDSPKLD
jgi:uncharacterized protein (DUF2062 family)